LGLQTQEESGPRDCQKIKVVWKDIKMCEVLELLLPFVSLAIWKVAGVPEDLGRLEAVGHAVHAVPVDVH
jgi:hypothetical protein